ncbi:MAG TPA: ABC transporter permease [Holosporales bacterium]|nr:ABC transporter permease [Holosporales bacterium]
MSFLKTCAIAFAFSSTMSPVWSDSASTEKLKSTKHRDVAITKITSHPSLDLIEKGVLDVLKKADPDLKIMSNNAQGNITIAAQIAQKFASLSPTVVVPITTPSAQTIVKAFKGTGIPIVFSAVTDPVGAHLLSSLKESTESLTGVVDQPPVTKIIEVMKLVKPDLKTVGVIYNAGEANSEFQIAAFRAAAEAQDIVVREVPVAKTADIQMAAASLVSDVEAIFLPNDNLVISSIEAIIKTAESRSVPVYVSDPESIERGAFAAIAFDQYEIGRATGKLLLEVLKTGSALNHPPVLLDNPKFYVNENVAESLGLSKEFIEGLKKKYNQFEETENPTVASS